MATVTFILRDGSPRSLTAGEDDPTVMHLAVRHDLPGLPADCGGQLACATCMVDVTPEWLDRVGPPGLDEGDMIEDALGARPPARRLACQIALTGALDGLVVTVPARQG